MQMPSGFLVDYSDRSDDELLQLASSRHSLTTEAAAGLDAELLRRNLTEADRIEHLKFVKREERRAGRKRRRKIHGIRSRWTWREILEFVATIAVISIAYMALPSHYQLSSDWEEAAFIVMLTSIAVIFVFKSWREIGFWIALGISSMVQLMLVHYRTRQVPHLSSAEAKGACVVGFVLFLLVYKSPHILRRMFYGKEAAENR